MRTIEDFVMMTPMRYYDNPEPKTPSAAQKRQDMIDNKDNEYIATEKHDGDWSMCIHFSKGNNLIRSRSISVKTGQYGDLTAKLPHLAAEMDEWPDNSVVLAEICWEQYGTNANTVGTILRCLPPKAVERQKENKLYGLIFDILMWDGKDLTDWSYHDRLYYTDNFHIERGYSGHYFKSTDIFFDNFAEEADRIISAGGEGLVIQKKSNPYMPGTRTAWATLKMKQSLPHMELKVVSTIEPNKLYDGMMPESWRYFEVSDANGVHKYDKNFIDARGDFENPDWEGVGVHETQYEPLPDAVFTPVTKPYYNGWKNGVNVDFNGVIVSVTSGLTDADREWLATKEAAELIANGELYAEIKAMSVNSQDSLRHPCLVRLRNDM